MRRTDGGGGSVGNDMARRSLLTNVRSRTDTEIGLSGPGSRGSSCPRGESALYGPPTHRQPRKDISPAMMPDRHCNLQCEGFNSDSVPFAEEDNPSLFWRTSVDTGCHVKSQFERGCVCVCGVDTVSVCAVKAQWRSQLLLASHKGFLGSGAVFLTVSFDTAVH